MRKVALSLVLLGASANAEPVALQAEAGAASFVGGTQSDRFGQGGGGALRLEVPLHRMLSVQVGGGASAFANGPAPDVEGAVNPGAASAFQAGGGVRVRPIPGADRLWIDSNAALVRTGDLSRLGVDGGLGYDVLRTDDVRGAPFVRYSHVFQPDTGLDGSDARIAMIGAAITWGRGSDVAPIEEEIAPPDTDGLGMPDVLDRCPEGLEDGDGFEDEDGCPEDDNDRDGIVDARDACPNVPEVQNGVEDADGCPDVAPVEVVDGSIILSERIYFETSKARVRTRSLPLLDAIATLLRERPDYARVRIEGHADDRGGPRFNRELSLLRAKRVAARLVALGVDASRLEFVGFGRERPAQPGRSTTARQANRRVEFRIIEVNEDVAPGREPEAHTVARRVP